jgi:hypothetical protein
MMASYGGSNPTANRSSDDTDCHTCNHELYRSWRIGIPPRYAKQQNRDYTEDRIAGRNRKCAPQKPAHSSIMFRSGSN